MIDSVIDSNDRFYLNKKVGGLGFAFDVFCVTLLFFASQSLLVLSC